MITVIVFAHLARQVLEHSTRRPVEKVHENLVPIDFKLLDNFWVQRSRPACGWPSQPCPR